MKITTELAERSRGKENWPRRRDVRDRREKKES